MIGTTNIYCAITKWQAVFEVRGIFNTALWVRYYYSHSAGEENKV